MGVQNDTKPIYISRDLHIDCKMAAIEEGVTLREWAQKTLRFVLKEAANEQSLGE